MKCPVCGIEMKLEGRTPDGTTWSCRNAKCQKHAEKQLVKEGKANES